MRAGFVVVVFVVLPACTSNDLPEPPPSTASITVENGSPAPNQETLTLTQFDNPELRTVVKLPDDLTLGSAVPLPNADNTVTPGGVRFAPGDLRLVVTAATDRRTPTELRWTKKKTPSTPT